MILSLAALFVLSPMTAMGPVEPVLSLLGGQSSPAAASDLDGRWEGAMSVPGGITIPFRLDIVGTGGTFAAPDMDVSGVPIEVVRAGPYISVRLPQAGAAFEAELSDDGNRLSGEWSQGGRAFPALFTRDGDIAAARAQTPRAPYSYLTRDASIPGGSDEVRLAATLTLPRSAGPVPAVLLLGGNGPQTRDGTYSGHRPMAVIADRLTREGVATLRYDKRGAGDSTGSYNRANGEDFAADATAAIGWLRAQPAVDASRICVLGWSEGALLALLISGQVSPACVVLLSPPGVDGPALIAEQARLRVLSAGGGPAAATDEAEVSFSLLTARAAGADEAELIELARQRGKSEDEAARLAREAVSPEIGIFLGLDPAVPAARVTAPVLIVAGSLDRQTPPDLNLPPLRRALAGNSLVRIVELTGLNHALQPARTGEPAEYATIAVTVDEAVLIEVSDFVARALPGA